MIDFEQIRQADHKQLRSFGLLVGAVGAAMFGLVLPWLFTYGYPLWPWPLGFSLAVLGLVAPALLRPFYVGWMVLGGALGWINTRIILGIMFYLLVLPIGLVFRLLGKDPMARRFQPELSSYRNKSDPAPSNHMERPY